MHFNTKNIIGKRFGKLIVTSLSNERSATGKLRYDCQCDCGKSYTTSGECLRRGGTNSCGCIKKGRPCRLKDRRYAILKNLYSNKIRKRSKQQLNTPFSLTFDDFCNLIQSPCYYCGVEYSKIAEDRWDCRQPMSSVVIKHNGIDRIDSSIGYTLENSRPCCYKCNFAKGVMTEIEFYSWVSQVNQHLNLNK